jgi:hypothetical protein
MKKTNSNKRCIQIGILDTQGYELDNRVYSRGGCCVTLKAGNAKVKVIRKYEKGDSVGRYR